MNAAPSSLFIRHFLSHQRFWTIALLLLWASANVIVLATSVIMEHRREGSPLPAWEPFCWELTSVGVLLLLIPVLVAITDRFIARLSFIRQVLVHIGLTLPFSIVHVSAMVSLRKLWYWLQGSHYHFGNLPYEFVYEYRKDVQTYFTFVLVIWAYRFIVRRLHGEVVAVGEGEQEGENEAESPERFLVKKLGREFLVKVEDIEWVEAAGNYANLHIGGNVYPMRTTMTKLEHTLPSSYFARIHRSYIVNLNMVKSVLALETGDYQITLQDDTQLSMSRRYREAFKAMAI